MKPTLQLWSFSLLRIPLLFIVRPVVLYLDEKRCEVKIPLNFLTKNHLRSMYFGVLSMGADLACGTMALDAIRRSGKKVSFIFKDFQADFLKRAESDVHFSCHDGEQIHETVCQAVQTGKRINIPMNIMATTPKISGDEPVAKFLLTLSLKYQASPSSTQGSSST